MQKVNTAQPVEQTWSSPKGKSVGAGKEISEELGRKPQSTDLNERDPIDIEICRIPPYYYPDSKKWSVPIPERRVLPSNALGYYDGEE